MMNTVLEHPRTQRKPSQVTTAPTSTDRIVAPSPRGGWHVTMPGNPNSHLWSETRAEALQWAWNITRDTGGQVILHHRDATLR